MRFNAANNSSDPLIIMASIQETANEPNSWSPVYTEIVPGNTPLTTYSLAFGYTDSIYGVQLVSSSLGDIDVGLCGFSAPEPSFLVLMSIGPVVGMVGLTWRRVRVNGIGTSAGPDVSDTPLHECV